MSRSKLRSSIDICSDCGSSDPSWASINRGILLCVQCCSVHRSMGRHISHVKSLRQGIWPQSLLAMVNTLTTQNVNSIWEHSLLDPSAPKHLRRKPQPKDSLHPTKAEFIQAKHRRLAYVFRPRRDDVPCSIAELSRQLHSSVRSANLDTSLRLLVQGADPNYFSQEKGTSCLHVACRAGHSSQAELLVAWGADPNSRDASGITPSQAARHGGFFELAERMVELVYEVTDRLAYYLCNQKPDHASGQHYINLDKMDTNEMTDIAKAARGKLQLLPNHLFEELVMDIYDEVDRRECEAVWNTSAVGLERFGVAFLPVNPVLSAPRNQGRQKLARLSPAEMASLLRDVLMDATRRQHIATLKPHSKANSLSASDNNIKKLSKIKQYSHLSDDEPLYDSVASDDDYAALVPLAQNNHKEYSASPKTGEIVSKTYEASVPIEQSCAQVQKPQTVVCSETIQEHVSIVQKSKEMEQLQEELNSKDNLISELKSELKQWQKTVENLTNENVILRNILDKTNSAITSNSPPTRDVSILLNSPKIFKTVAERNNSKESDGVDTFDNRSLNRSNQRPISMYETREGPKLNWQITKHQLTTVGDLDRGFAQSLCNKTNLVPEESQVSRMPSAVDVHNFAEGVTKGIRELWAAMQDSGTPGHTFVLRADKIKQAVHQLLGIFPDKCENENVCSVLSQLSTCCEGLTRACSLCGSNGEVPETDTMQHIPSAAYELAKATKLLVTNFPLDQNVS